VLIITVIGRETGREYGLRVGYVKLDDALLVGTAARWRLNLRPGVPVRVHLRGRDRHADDEVITDDARAADLYRVIQQRHPVHVRFGGMASSQMGARIRPTGTRYWPTAQQPPD
jgi:hypothetical protein